MNNYRKFAKDLLRSARLTGRLTEHGIKCRHRKNLDRISNTRWNGDRLIDGTCHYTNRVEFTGKTYPIKGIFKSHGFRWDPTKKCWWAAVNVGSDWELNRVASVWDISAEICRRLST